MQTYEYYTEDTLRSFNVFIDSLKSDDPIGSGSMRVSCYSLCSSINNLLEYLYIEKKEFIDKKFSVNTKNNFVKKLVNETHDLQVCKVVGNFLKMTLNVGDASKHKLIDRNHPYINDISQVKESLLVIVNEDSEGQYLAIEKGVVVLNDKKVAFNLEVFVIISLEVITKLLLEFEIIDTAPNLKGSYRNFYLSREESEKTFTRNCDICAIPQYTKGGEPPVLIQYFDDSSFPLKIRDSRKNEGLNFEISVPIRVVPNPLLNNPR